MKQMQQMQERVQKEIAEIEVEASAGGGMVKAVMDGEKHLKSLTIDPEVVSRDDVEMLQDLVTAAVNEGIRAAQRMVAEEMQKVTGGIGIKLPGLG
jgi:DNA-binding YbaB/EbfC family protein